MRRLRYNGNACKETVDLCTLSWRAFRIAVSAVLVLGMSPLCGFALQEDVGALAAASGAELEGQTTRPPTPELNSASSGMAGYVGLSWALPENSDETSNDGVGTVDHFNVYRGNRLFAQVDRSAVSESVQYNDHSVRSYGWHVSFPMPDAEVEYEWCVTAVAPDGTEGDPSESMWAGSLPGMSIRCHTAWFSKSYYDDPTGQKRPCMLVRINPYNSPGTLSWLEFWRAEGTAAPDTGGEPYMRVPKDHAISGYYTQHDLEDYGVEPGKTYTYTVRGTDSDGVQTGFYTFTVKAVMASDSAAIYYGMEEISCRVQNGTTPTLTFTAYTWKDDGAPVTYNVYRNNALEESINGDGRQQVFSDTPTVDGTYVYRVDQVVAGVTTKSREFTFHSDTTPVDPSALQKAPGAPQLTGRISMSNDAFSGDAGIVTLEWAPSDEGGEVEGFHIYRKDAGTFVEGFYYYPSWRVNLLWSLNRYLTIRDADVRSFTDKHGNYNDDSTQGVLVDLSWDDMSTPHEYYVTAYNKYGESAPSNLVTFPYAGGSAPVTQDVAAPNAPTIKRAWVEWSDASSESRYVDSGAFDEYPSAEIRVAFDEPVGGGVDFYAVQFESDSENGEPHDYDGDGMIDDTSWATEDIPRWAFVRYPSLLSGASEESYSERYLPNHTVGYYDYGSTFTVTVTAKNSKGEAVSQPVQVVVNSIPLIQAKGGNAHTLVRWSDLYQDEATEVSNWELYRTPEHGMPQLVDTFGADVREYDDTAVKNGWAYTYHVVAKCADGIDRRSVDAEVSVSAANEVPAAPTDLEARVVSGEVVLSWTQPDTGGAVAFYVCDIVEPGQEWPADDEYHYTLLDTAGTGTCLTLQSQWLDKDMQIRIYAVGEGGNLRSAASNVATFKLTSAEEAQRATTVPDIVWIHGTAGVGSCTLTWDASTNADYSPATYYVLTRSSSNDTASFTIPAKGTGAQSYEYVDTTVENGVNYTYEVRAFNSAGEQSGNWNFNKVTLKPQGRTHDQEVAESVAARIEALPNPDDVTAADADAIGTVQEIWVGLSDTQQRLVGSELAQKLAADVQALEDLRLVDEYGDAVAAVQALVDALPDAVNVQLSDELQVAEARTAYDALTSVAAKRLVKRVSRLTDAEAALQVLKYKPAADEVAAQINALPDASEVTLDDKPAVDAARAALDGLTPEQRAYVPIDSIAHLTTVEQAIRDIEQHDPTVATVPMYRLYNPNSGEHFYTGDAEEREAVIAAGWNDEQVGWYAPADDTSVPVYRMYNANGGEHHYTTDAEERDMLVAAGWNYEGIGWYSDPAETVALLREYNPNQFACNHNYTTNTDEHDFLVSLGWRDEGCAWYAVKAGE